MIDVYPDLGLYFKQIGKTSGTYKFSDINIYRFDRINPEYFAFRTHISYGDGFYNAVFALTNCIFQDFLKSSLTDKSYNRLHTSYFGPEQSYLPYDLAILYVKCNITARITNVFSEPDFWKDFDDLDSQDDQKFQEFIVDSLSINEWHEKEHWYWLDFS